MPLSGSYGFRFQLIPLALTGRNVDAAGREDDPITF